MKIVIMTLVTLALVACGSKAPPPQAPSLPGGALAVAGGRAESLPYAPAGTDVEVRIDQPVDSRLNRPGDSISATLTSPIRSTTGQVLIPAGAKLFGKIARIDRFGGSAQLVLDFNGVELSNAVAPIGVRVVSAEQSRYDVTPVPGGVTNVQPGGPSQAGAQPSTEVSMRRGAALRLVLTRPIVNAQAIEK